MIIEAPAGDGAVQSQTAGVEDPGADGGHATGRANEKDDDDIPYDEWNSSTLTREDIVPLEELPLNPMAGG